MIKFIDLQTGNLFEGGYNPNQFDENYDHPYIFWFEDQQSVNLLYTKKICFISDQSTHQINLDGGTIFTLLNPNINSTKININEFQYIDIDDWKVIDNSMILHGHPYKNSGYYIYMIYILGSAIQAGEYVCQCKIDDYIIKIGADFYNENENLYINLTNNGIEIPDCIQKAIYPSNIHEEKRDDILLNRKWKELLSNMWDIIANKGSYKSLYNSLKWFEYGDLVQLNEIWKRKDNQ